MGQNRLLQAPWVMACSILVRVWAIYLMGIPRSTLPHGYVTMYVVTFL